MQDHESGFLWKSITPCIEFFFPHPLNFTLLPELVAVAAGTVITAATIEQGKAAPCLGLASGGIHSLIFLAFNRAGREGRGSSRGLTINQRLVYSRVGY